jgi:hypothetical protein
VLIAPRSAAQYVPPDFYDETYMKSIGFWENNGQIVDTDEQPRPDIRFYSEGAFPRAYLRDKSRISFVVAVVDTNPGTTDTLYRLDMRPAGRNANEVAPQGWAQKDWHQNYYMAHTGTAGAAEVAGYSRVYYEDIYPSIDLHFYSGSKGQKMAFVLRPGCSPDDLKLPFNGQDSIAVDLWGNLKIYKDGKWMVMPFAQAYQVNGSGAAVPISWSASYQVDNGAGVVGFQWSSYNANWPLVFQIGIPPFGPAFFDEPGLCWSTYMGGNEQDYVYESTQDENDNYYIVGTTGSAFMTFPAAPGTNYSVAGTAAYMMRFNTTDNIVWKTFVGGNAAGETTRGTALANKVNGEVYLGGYTDSESIAPYQAPGGQEFYQPSATGPDNKGLLVRLQESSGARQWITYYGQNGLTIQGMVAVSNKKIFITGSTEAELPELDVTAPPGSDYWDYQAGKDGFIAMFNDLDQHAWRTHLPGNADDEAWDIDATDTRLAVAGTTSSADMNIQSAGTGSYAVGAFGNGDCFIYEYTTNGALLWGTYAGTSSFDFISDNAVAIDPQTKDIVISGRTGFGLDIVQGPGWYQSTVPFGTPASFILRFAGSNRARTWSTYLHNGAGSSTDIRALQFDPTGKLYIAGRVRDGSGLLLQPLPGIYQQNAYNIDVVGASTEASDPFLLCFGPGNAFLWGTYFGGVASAAYHELIYTILWRNLNGNIYAGGYTSKDADPLSYFPLDDGGGIPYFEELWQGGLTEGFLAAFCGEALNAVGIAESAGASGAGFTAIWSGDHLTVCGLHPGQLAYQIVDAQGRAVARGNARSNGLADRWPLPGLAMGTYVLQTTAGAARFTVIR